MAVTQRKGIVWRDAKTSRARVDASLVLVPLLSDARSAVSSASAKTVGSNTTAVSFVNIATRQHTRDATNQRVRDWDLTAARLGLRDFLRDVVVPAVSAAGEGAAYFR